MDYAIVSGGFDPVHVGHVRMFKEAAKLGKLIVILNNDNWLKLKKGFVFMPQDERKEIIEGFGAHEVIITDHPPDTTDISVCETLKALRKKYPKDHLIFINGGDRKADNIPEYELCPKLGIEMLFNVGWGGKVQSSSDLVKNAKPVS